MLSREGVDGAGPSKGPGAGSLETQEASTSTAAWSRRGMVRPEGHSRVQLFPMLCLRGNRARCEEVWGGGWALPLPSPPLLLFYPLPPFLSPSLSSLSPFPHSFPPSIHLSSCSQD